MEATFRNCTAQSSPMSPPKWPGGGSQASGGGHSHGGCRGGQAPSTQVTELGWDGAQWLSQVLKDSVQWKPQSARDHPTFTSMNPHPPFACTPCCFPDLLTAAVPPPAMLPVSTQQAGHRAWNASAQLLAQTYTVV